MRVVSRTVVLAVVKSMGVGGAAYFSAMDPADADQALKADTADASSGFDLKWGEAL